MKFLDGLKMKIIYNLIVEVKLKRINCKLLLIIIKQRHSQLHGLQNSKSPLRMKFKLNRINLLNKKMMMFFNKIADMKMMENFCKMKMNIK
jgi:hypothetical protein